MNIFCHWRYEWPVAFGREKKIASTPFTANLSAFAGPGSNKDFAHLELKPNHQTKHLDDMTWMNSVLKVDGHKGDLCWSSRGPERHSRDS